MYRIQQPNKRVLILKNQYSDSANKAGNLLTSYLKGVEAEVVEEADHTEVDLVICLGGDGTLLKVSYCQFTWNTPREGINSLEKV